MAKNYRAQLTGAFGCPIDENPTGVIMEAAYQEMGLNFRYITMLLNKGDLSTAIDGIKAMHFRGINLTIPHKVDGVALMDKLSPAASITGAINVVINDDGVLTGENTDGKGLLKSLSDEGVTVADKTVTVLGAGGASRAISVECALAGAGKVYIVNRNAERGTELTDLIREKTDAAAEYIAWSSNVSVPEDTDILINATSIGLYPNVNDQPDIDYQTITKDMVVSDVIFNDPRTRFLAEAKKQGAKTINGLGMLVNQAAVNFKLWTGEDAPIETMTRVLMAEFGLE